MHKAAPLLILAITFFCIIAPSIKAQDNFIEKDSLRINTMRCILQAEQLLSNPDTERADSAYVLLKSAIKVTLDNYGYYDSLYVWAQNWLSHYYYYTGDLGGVEKCALTMSEIVDSAFSDNLRMIVYSKMLLGDYYVEVSDFSRAVDVYEQLMTKLKGVNEPDNEIISWLLITMHNLAKTEAVQGGKEEKALKTYKDAIKLAEEYQLTDSRVYATIKANIGRPLEYLGRYEEACMCYKDAEALIKKAYGSKSKQSVWLSCNIADCYRWGGDYQSADSILSLQMDIVNNTVGEAHPWFANVLAGQAILLAETGDLQNAIKKAIRITKIIRNKSKYSTLGLMQGLRLLGKIAVVADSSSLLADAINEISEIRQSFLLNVFQYASETQKLTYVRRHPPIEPQLLSGVIESDNRTSVYAAAEMILNGKGLAVDVMASEQSTAYCANDPILDSLLNEHKQISSRIAGLAMSRGGGKDEMLEDLFSTKDQIEMELSLACSNLDLASGRKRVTADDVLSAIPQNSVLWEFVKYEYYDYTKAFHYFGHDSSYAAITLTPDSRIKIIDLGKAPLIDSLIYQYQTIMSEAHEEILTGQDQLAMQKYMDISSRLYERIIAPLESTLEDSEQVFVCPDGLINLLPFETLTGDGQNYLIEDHQFVYLTTGRDLLKDKTDISNRDAIVMANPDFMLDPTVSPALASESTPMFAHRGNTATPECLKNMFSPLPKTRLEGNSVVGILKETEKYNVYYLESESARESYLKDLAQPPQIIHIATHGYFCREAENVYLSNPLLRSGLILAGANRTIGEMNEGAYGSEDGILTAMEVSGLNLIGTDLVVLSACQSGVGDVQSGEGVFGLRRAFQHAGVKSIIMSLFDIPDKTTSDLMERFYSNWLSGSSKEAALRNASLSVLKELRGEHGIPHPLFWGGFILAGNPN